MKILVTGGCGYIGSHTTLCLLESGYEVIVLDNLSNSSAESLSRVAQITHKTAQFIEGDIKDALLLDKLFSEYKPDAVIHFAAYIEVGESMNEPMLVI